MGRAKALSEAQWVQVFQARCRSKRGERLTDDEQKLVDAAYSSDPKRYQAMEPEVFDATVPFGSSARAK